MRILKYLSVLLSFAAAAVFFGLALATPPIEAALSLVYLVLTMCCVIAPFLVVCHGHVKVWLNKPDPYEPPGGNP